MLWVLKEIFVHRLFAQGGDYVISLKGNQGALHKDVADYFANPKLISTCDSSEENDKGHGRLERRIAYSCEAIDWLQKEHRWPGLKALAWLILLLRKKGNNTKSKDFTLLRCHQMPNC